MKKYLSIFYLLLLAACLSACSESNKKYHIGVSQCSHDIWHDQMNHEMRREANFDKHVKLDIRCAHDNNAQQIRQIDSLIQSGIDLLVVIPNESKALAPAVERALKQGIPVVLADRRVTPPHYTAYVGADNRSIGRDVGAYLVKLLPQGGTVAEFVGQRKVSVSRDRHNGLMDIIGSHPEIRLIAQVESGWEGPRIEAQIDSMLRSGTVPQVILAPNDRTGVRIRRALVRAGHADIKIVGIDGQAQPGRGLDNVEQGDIQATFVYPTGGDKVIQTAMHILRHEPYKRDTKLRSAVIDASTARIFRMQYEQIAESEKRIDQMEQKMNAYLSRYSMQKLLLLACLVIILLIGAMTCMGVRLYYSTIQRNDKLKQQKQKLEEQRDQLVRMSKELEETTQSKISFFTGVSHDLRTPLTLILAPVEQLQGAKNLTEEQHGLLRVVQANADILLRLVAQTLDFRKFENGQLRLNLQRYTLREAIHQWCAPFATLARQRIVRFHLNMDALPTEGEASQGWLDAQKMESIIYNILSNAFKFTPEGGHISVTASLSTDTDHQPQLQLVMEDTGQGIDADKLPHIFDRFYQVDATREGSGIGLATVKAYVDLMQGSVKAESNRGTGTRFIVSVPINAQAETKQHEKDTPIVDDMTTSHSMTQLTSQLALNQVAEKALSGDTDQATADNNDKRPTVLIIDDNEEIRAYITLLLHKDYVVRTAANGKEGLEMARRMLPDVVVCDMMMPIMDGRECCRHIKEEWQTSHIPVMMLTACAMDDDRIAAFNSGADSYISKPFSPEIFRSRLRNLLDNRHRMQKFFRDQTGAAAATLSAEASEADKSFIERFRTLVEQHLADTDLSVEYLASQLGIGRSQLYRKVKQLTGFSPVELIRIRRIKKAAELLTRTDKSISEIAYEVGFATPSYLTKCFKDYFGVSPKEYVASPPSA